MGGVRHVADIKADDMSREGAGVIGLQAGSNKGASQAGQYHTITSSTSRNCSTLTNYNLADVTDVVV